MEPSILEKRKEMKTGFVLLPGAGMSDWLWSSLMPLLNGPAMVISPRIPDNTKEKRLSISFKEVMDFHIEQIVKSGFEQVIVVGHSGAGLIAGALGKEEPHVKHVVFIAANIPQNGKTAIDVFPEEIQRKNIEAIKAQAEFDSLSLKNLETMFVSYFCNTCTEKQIQFILNQKFYPEPVCAITAKMNWDNYPKIGKSYVICSKDKTLTLDQQKILAGNLGIQDLTIIDSGHLPMISHKEDLAKVLNAVYARWNPPT
jgi:pimeloyl-ACP methyl ester carboxylesterase